LQEVGSQGFGKEFQLGRRGRRCGKQYQLTVPEVDGSYQAGQPGGQKVKTKLREHVDFACFCDDRLKAGIQRKQSADFGRLHG
jgi:hypothetical protein